VNDLQNQTDQILLWLKAIDHDLQMLQFDVIAVGTILALLLGGILAFGFFNNR
jgi:hypothetical protein